MFNRFTERARQVLILAQEEALRLNHPYVGTEHILLGLIKEGQGVAARALDSIGIEADKVRSVVEQAVGKGQGGPGGQEITFTPRGKRILELSVEEARRMGHNYVGTEHFLLGLIKEGEGVAAQVLKGMGGDLDRVRQVVLEMLGDNGQSGDSNSSQACNSCRGSSKTSSLDQFSRDLSAMARQDKLDPVVGREKEIERVIQILSRRTKNNPVLIGEPGVGKTAIVEGLAQRVVAGNVPEVLLDKRVVTLDIASMVAGTKYRGEFEERLKKTIEEIIGSNNVIVFIDELHTIIGAGAAEGAIDAANILKPALARGEMQCIGATTVDDYRKYIEKDPALERRFQPIMVEEPTVEETIAILRGLRDKYEAHHRVRITDKALEEAARFSDRYITDRFQPDKAIDLIDEASSRVRLKAYTAPPDVKNIEKELESTKKEKEAAINNQEFEKAAQMRDREQNLKKELESTREQWKQQQGGLELTVGEEDIAHIVSIWTGVPVSKLAEEESDRLMKLEEVLHHRVVGQDEAVKAVSRAVRRARAGLKDPRRPVGSFIFLGPTGVGKTELGRALAEVLFGNQDAMVRLDMSEYMEKFAASRLVGAPPGYVGYEEGGQLTEAVRRKPYSVVLLDEIEKAHPDVFNMLLQVLEDGRLTDSRGRVVDFRNAVIIMTSNVGVSILNRESTLGFRTGDREDSGYEKMKEKVNEDLKRTFRPEFLNRIDEIIVFHALNKEHIKEIVGLMLREVVERVKANNIDLEVTDSVRGYLAEEGFDKNYGARPLRRAIQRQIEDRISEAMLSGTIRDGDNVIIDMENDKVVVKRGDGNSVSVDPAIHPEEAGGDASADWVH
ncbi:MAG: ATP-dependent Clp protease ATP-binding subunit [Desulfocucumaceae bacterium]